MQVTVRFFGPLREATGLERSRVELGAGATIGSLRSQLAAAHPIFDQLGDRLRASRNFDVAPDETPLEEGDEVAFLPPVAGGQGAAGPRCWISEEPLDVQAVIERVSGPECGGLVSFIGAVRDESRGQTIRHLEYEAYPGMVERELERIADTAAERWPGVRVAVAHRTGRLEVGEIAVVVAAAAPHREAAFEAARFTIDTLKERAPIWKKEVATDGAYWVDEHA